MGLYRVNKFAGRALTASGLGGLLRRAGSWNGILALAYHRIGDGSTSTFDRGLWSATAEDLDAQVAMLKKDCDVIGPHQLAEAAAAGRGRFGLITFDDGYRDNYTAAFPVLKSHKVPGVFFVSTGFIDRPHIPWWDEVAWMVRSSSTRGVAGGEWLDEDVQWDEPDREGAIRTLLRRYKTLSGADTARYVEFLADATGSGRYRAGRGSDVWMGWEMLREMVSNGMFVGGHTVNHPVLARLGAREQDDEIAGCAERIRVELGVPMRWFSYPVGGRDSFNNDTRESLARHGVELAFSYYGTLGRLDRLDRFDVPRVAVESDTTRGDFGAMLALPRVYA